MLGGFKCLSAGLLLSFWLLSGAFAVSSLLLGGLVVFSILLPLGQVLPSVLWLRFASWLRLLSDLCQDSVVGCLARLLASFFYFVGGFIPCLV
jgi:hypothetical protein